MRSSLAKEKGMVACICNPSSQRQENCCEEQGHSVFKDNQVYSARPSLKNKKKKKIRKDGVYLGGDRVLLQCAQTLEFISRAKT